MGEKPEMKGCLGVFSLSALEIKRMSCRTLRHRARDERGRRHTHTHTPTHTQMPSFPRCGLKCTAVCKDAATEAGGRESTERTGRIEESLQRTRGTNRQKRVDGGGEKRVLDRDDDI